MVPAESLTVGFKRHLRAETIPAEAVYLISGTGVTALLGPSIERIAPLLDGTRTIDQLTRDVLPDLAGAEVVQLLDRLMEANLIEYRQGASAQLAPATAAYWSLAGLDPEQAAATVRTARVEIIIIGDTDDQRVREALRASDLVEAGPEDEPALSLVFCDDYLDPELAAVNLAQLRRRRPWLLAKLSGPEPWAGPVFSPGDGPCWACLAKRLEGNRYGDVLLREALGPGGASRPPDASLPVGRVLGLSVVMLEGIKWLAGLRYPGQHNVSILDTLAMQWHGHSVATRPQCPACGDPGLVAARARQPLMLWSRRIAARNVGGYRALTPDQMLSRFAHLVDPVTGIVGELRRTPDSPDFLQSYLSGRNRAVTVKGVRQIGAALSISNGGKGATPLEAQVGALCEAVERYCATRCGDELVVRDSYRGLGSVAVHPAACMLFDERQYADRIRWNATCAPFHHVPEPFDECAAIDWTPVWSLLTGQQRLLPTALLYYSPVGTSANRSLYADSNGNAAGGSLEDAIIHGFLELVERDAVSLWWYNRTRQPLVGLESFGDPWLAGMPGLFRKIKREIWVLDVTADLGIPVMAAVSRRTDKTAEDILFGFGAHPDPQVAAQRALAEVGQLLPGVARARADGSGYDGAAEHLRRWWIGATVRNQPYLRPDPQQRVRKAADYRYVPAPTLRMDMVYAAARRADLDVLVVDQTRPDITMPVAKVVVPGLRHFWPRFAPGRLYDVPVALGRLQLPTRYEDINPIPIYLLYRSRMMNIDTEPETPRPHELWSLREDVEVDFQSEEGLVRLRSPWVEFTIPRASASVREALHRMRLGPVSLENILNVTVEGSNDSGQQQLFGVLRQLQSLVVRSVKLASGRPLLSVVPLTPRSVFSPRPLEWDASVRMSAFAELRTNGHEYRLESPLALHQVVLHQPDAIRLIGVLARPVTPAEVVSALPGMESLAVAALEYLIAARVVAQAVASDADGTFAFSEDVDLALAGWSPADLMFHTRSTLGRHDREIGVTYPMDDAGVAWSGEPVVKPPLPHPSVPLHRPRWDDLCASDPPLTVAIEGRRSVSEHEGEPVTLTELGDLLYRACRVRWLSDASGAASLAPRVVALRQLSDRPYPGGGACYELELYVTSSQCAGLARGVYHYDPLGHRLELVNSDPETVDELLRSASIAAPSVGYPQVLITMTARVRRLSWKYSGLPYRIMLIDVGILFQTLYLVCTAMRLAPCALGAVSGELAARAFGTDWRSEPGVAQFIVGRAVTGNRHLGLWQPVNDGQWTERAHAILSAGGSSPAPVRPQQDTSGTGHSGHGGSSNAVSHLASSNLSSERAKR